MHLTAREPGSFAPDWVYGLTAIWPRTTTACGPKPSLMSCVGIYGANHHTMPTMTNGKVRSIRLKTLLRVMTSLRYLCGSLVIGHYPKIMELVPDLRRTQFAERVFRAVEGGIFS